MRRQEMSAAAAPGDTHGRWAASQHWAMLPRCSKSTCMTFGLKATANFLADSSTASVAAVRGCIPILAACRAAAPLLGTAAGTDVHVLGQGTSHQPICHVVPRECHRSHVGTAAGRGVPETQFLQDWAAQGRYCQQRLSLEAGSSTIHLEMCHQATEQPQLSPRNLLHLLQATPDICDRWCLRKPLV